MRLRNLKQNPSILFRYLGVRVRESSPYIRIAPNVERNMRSLVFTGNFEFHTRRSFLYAVSARPAPCKKATWKGCSHAIIDPGYLSCGVVWTPAPLANFKVVVSLGVLVRSSVLVSLSFIPYSAAIFSTEFRNDWRGFRV